MIKNPKHLLLFLLFLVLCYFPLFLHLDSFTLRLWDEGRRAVNAFEMVQNGNLLVPHYNGEPDMWGTKPPLLVWMQAGFMQVLGYNELAVRLPSALSGLATVLLMGWFGYRQMNKPLWGAFAGLALLTMTGYIMSTHSVRTGDYDALLTLWLTGGLLFFYCFVHAPDDGERNRYLSLTTACLALGALTKGVAGLFFLPGMFLYALLQKELIPILRRRETYLAIVLFIIPVLGYYLLRERINPGYIQAVWDNELGGRYMDATEGHNHRFGFYFEELVNTRMTYWAWFSIAGIFLGIREGGKMRQVTLLLGITAIAFLLVLSNSQSKLAWYDLPAFPALALLAAVPVSLAFDWCRRQTWFPGDWRRYLLYLLLFTVVFGYPYARAIERVYHREDRGYDWEKVQYGYFIRDNPEFREYAIGIDEYNPQVDFYRKKYNARGYDLRIERLRDSLVPGARVLVCDPVYKDKLWSLHQGNMEPVRVQEPCVLWTINGGR